MRADRKPRHLDALLVRRFRSKLMAWYERHGRRFEWRRDGRLSEYEIVITESLLQRTRAETVARFVGAFLKEFPSWNELAMASPARLEAYLRPIGLWRRRADTLLRLAAAVRDLGGLPATRESLERLPGVGQYIANAIMLMRDKRAEPLLDVNMARVLERFFGPRQMADIRYDPYLQSLSRRVVRSKQSHLVSWAILDLAAAACVSAIPRCEICPLSTDCLSAFKIKSRPPPRSFRVLAATMQKLASLPSTNEKTPSATKSAGSHDQRGSKRAGRPILRPKPRI